MRYNKRIILYIFSNSGRGTNGCTSYKFFSNYGPRISHTLVMYSGSEKIFLTQEHKSNIGKKDRINISRRGIGANNQMITNMQTLEYYSANIFARRNTCFVRLNTS